MSQRSGLRAHIDMSQQGPTPTDIGSFEDFGDVDLDEMVPLSLMILPQCIDACAAGLET